MNKIQNLLTVLAERFISLISITPFLQPLTSFSPHSHKRASIKWLILIIAASSPVLITVLLSPIPDGDISVFQKMISKLKESINVSEQFVYSASFLAPTLFLVWDKFHDESQRKSMPEEDSAFHRFKNVMKVYRGYGWILSGSIFVLIITVLGFSFIKTGNPAFANTFLYKLLTELSLYIYLFSLYAFYLSIIQEYGIAGSYSDSHKESEKMVSAGLRNRVQGGRS